MNARQRIQAILNRDPVDRIPVDLWYTPEVYAVLAGHYGVGERHELYRAMGLDKLDWINADYVGPLRPAELPGETTNLWGQRLSAVQAGEAAYNENLQPPLTGYDSIESLDDYPWWPDPEHFDYAGAAGKARRWSGEFATLGPWVSFFEVYCGMRGLEQAMLDVLMMPDYVNAVLDRIEHAQTELLKRFYSLAGDGIDLAFISDDMGSQTGMLLGMELWEELIAPRLARWCRLIHDHNIRVLYHSDGAIGPLIPRLIECGVDVLNPIQHVCPGMSCEELKSQYGNRLIFHGGVENQKILPFGTPDDVRAETRHCLKTLGRDGGYIACSCHNVQPGTPLENILAMVETVRRAGRVTREAGVH